MKTTHVFIVDTITFKLHLEYLFAGTGAKDSIIDFNGTSNTSLKATSENNLVSMIADSQRVRKGDFIIFYLQQNYSQNVYDGRFYGIFKVKEDLSFLDNNNNSQFLKDELIKSLTFRTLIEPYEVYSKGVTEWEALDEIKYLQSPNQMLWSLIYRKLKGNRGNTMITIYESERLFKLLRDKNSRIQLNGNSFTFDCSKQEIIISNNSHIYLGKKDPIDIFVRLKKKYYDRKAFESHLQAYIVQNIGRNKNRSLDECLLTGATLEWLGNEVSCGVGMQRIDIALSVVKNDIKLIIPIELKACEAETRNVIQIQRYVDWLNQYYIPNRISDIQPVLISKKIYNKNNICYTGITDSFKAFNESNKNCLPLKYIEYQIVNECLEFNEVSY